MSKLRAHLSFSILSACYTGIGVLVVVYIALIAVVMSYAALTVSFSQSVKSDEAVVAILESEYLTDVARIANMDYSTAGYVKPSTLVFVRTQSATALR